MLWFLLSSFFISLPNLSGQRLDVYHTSTHGVALVGHWPTFLVVMVSAGMAYRQLFHAADKFCETHLEACGLSANIRHVYWHLFVSRKSTGLTCTLVTS